MIAVRSRHRRGATMLLASTVAGTLALAGCSSSSSGGSTTTGGSTSDSAAVTTAQATVTKAYGNSFLPPPTSGPAAQKGKNVWWLSCGFSDPTCNATSSYFKAAGAALGWNVTVFDTKGDPTVAAAGIRQAIAAHADGIAAQSQDCTGIQSALQAAKAANIPFVPMLSEDCNAGGGQALFAAQLNFGGYATQKAWTTAWAKTKAAYVIAKTDGKAKIIDLTLTNLIPTQQIDAGFKAGIAACSGCTIVDTVSFTTSDIPAKFLAKVQTALTQHPDATVVHVPFDAVMSFGLVPLLQRSGRKLIVGGGEGGVPNMAFIRQGVQTFSLAFPYEWMTWATADTLNRVFAGQPGVPEGGGFQFVDTDHNLPASGGYQPQTDFKSAYTKIWAGS